MGANKTAKAKYRELTEKLLENETWGTLSEQKEDALRDEMDPLWWLMTEDERLDVDNWLDERRNRAPKSLSLREIEPSQQGPLHRQNSAI